MIKTVADMIELMHEYWGADDEVHKDLDRILELHNQEVEQGRADAIDECISLARAEIDFESQAEQKRFVEFMEGLREQNND